jgi:hypothetical protein
VTDQRAPEIDLGVAQAGEARAKHDGSRPLARQHGIGSITPPIALCRAP